MRERDWRRAQRALAIRRARSRARIIGMQSSERWILKSATTPHPCSGHCCGNPRRHGDGDPLCVRRVLQDDGFDV